MGTLLLTAHGDIIKNAQHPRGRFYFARMGTFLLCLDKTRLKADRGASLWYDLAVGVAQSIQPQVSNGKLPIKPLKL